MRCLLPSFYLCNSEVKVAGSLTHLPLLERNPIKNVESSSCLDLHRQWNAYI